MPAVRLLRYLKCFAILSLVTGILPQLASAQSYSQQFDSYFLREHPDTVKIHTLLRLWQRMEPDDPELYVSAFNFYLAQSRSSSADSAAAFQRLRPATEWINAGIAKFPERLDMRFGKAHMLRTTGQFDSFLAVMQQTLNRSVENRNHWQWVKSAALDSGRQFMLQQMHTYQRELYETGRPALLPVMTALGASIVTTYPEDVEALTTTAVGLILQTRYDQAIGYLRRAENVRPQDAVVLTNLFEAYRLKGDKSAARRYIELIEKAGGAEGRATARKLRKSLRRD